MGAFSPDPIWRTGFSIVGGEIGLPVREVFAEKHRMTFNFNKIDVLYVVILKINVDF
jgi:hypothetical protein